MLTSMKRAEELLREALALDDEEREWLIRELASSLPEDPHAQEAWDQEIDRRLDAVDSGAMESIPAPEALRRLRDRGRGKR